eukprot:12767930-Alexandrium_andersonii.AAC.2
MTPQKDRRRRPCSEDSRVRLRDGGVFGEAWLLIPIQSERPSMSSVPKQECPQKKLLKANQAESPASRRSLINACQWKRVQAQLEQVLRSVTMAAPPRPNTFCWHLPLPNRYPNPLSSRIPLPAHLVPKSTKHQPNSK